MASASDDNSKHEQLANELHRCILKDQLVRAKFLLKGIRKDERRSIVCRAIAGNPPLFVAAQRGLQYFVNFLIEECGADIEQKGIYEVQEDHSKHKVSPLWCAAVANKLDIVKLLVKHGAMVNAPSDTQSTPVRSACYMTNIEVVKYLVDQGADIHKPNINGGTCLINSVQSVELCRFLIERGADVNAQDNSGNLALHYAIREGRFGTVQLLLDCHSDPYVKNDFGDDAIQTAALRGHVEIFEFLIEKVQPDKLRKIEAYELMATNYVDEKHDLQKAIHLWKEAMSLRHEDKEAVVQKPSTGPCLAYQNAKECDNLAELEEKATVPDSIYMEALLVRERILGPDHKDTVFGLMYRGAVYADTHRYQRCVDLWKYAFCLRHRKLEPLNHECLFTLQALCKLFWEIYEEQSRDLMSEKVEQSDVLDVLEMSVVEVDMGQSVLKSRPVQQSQVDEFHVLLQLIVHIIHLMSLLLKATPNSEYMHSFHRLVTKLVRMNPQGKNEETLLHLAVDEQNTFIVDEFYSTLPNPDMINVLLHCGSAVNARDRHGNTALHLCGRQASTQVVHDADNLNSVVKILIAHDAHVDARNDQGDVAYEKFARYCKGFMPSQHMTLKCFCAKQIKKSQIKYEGEVPRTLIPFIELH